MSSTQCSFSMYPLGFKLFACTDAAIIHCANAHTHKHTHTYTHTKPIWQSVVDKQSCNKAKRECPSRDYLILANFRLGQITGNRDKCIGIARKRQGWYQGEQSLLGDSRLRGINQNII